ncbi:porphobilinogen deaminase [Thermoproteus uzoniensis 768-20]|uniref:Probable porphobilinogen deaminase n=1 Tax=Thermoproteus uzoniensis (strain 768-20) TaxID=999630 RepID=F2L4T1_THEU7|nr:hydroxymethylbilane synthase [Thermoproteus uzoniensis]AEA13435.1 porphobilinogen deaminase [Thermoproteus uzoniensis 768-20]
MKLRVATRGSKLSLLQTELFIKSIKEVEPDLEFEIVVVKTTGDLVQDRPLYAIGVKGVFEKEVNLAVLRGQADVAVHSLKDLPSEIHEDLVVAGYSKRDSPYDAIASTRGYDVWGLPRGARVGTSSVRRGAFLKSIRPDLHIEPLRGNVDTRIGKVLSGAVDAAVLAEAGVRRLYGENPPVEIRRVKPDEIPPPPGQGIVAAVARKDDRGIIDLLRKASDPRAALEARAERAFLKEMGGGCHVAVGGLATATPNGIEFLAGWASVDGSRKVLVKAFGESPEEVGVRAARMLKSALGPPHGHRV